MCPRCSYQNSKVIKTLHNADDFTFRIRHCMECGLVYKTKEYPIAQQIYNQTLMKSKWINISKV